jgi:hypothetical protein
VDKTKQWVALAVLAALVVLSGGWFLVVAPTRGEAAELQAQAELQESTNAQLATALDVLRDKAEALPEKRAELAEAAGRIPDGPALPDLLRALAAAASSAGVELTSVTPTAPAPVATPAAAAPVVDPAAPADPAAAPPATPPAPAPAPASGLSAMDVTMVVAGDFYAVEQFVVLLEELPRALRVTGLSMRPGASALSDAPTPSASAGRSVETTLTGRVYLSSAAADPAPAAGAAGAAAPVVPAPAVAPAQPSESVS